MATFKGSMNKRSRDAQNLPETPSISVDDIVESHIPLPEAVHLVKSLAIAYKEKPIALHVYCKQNDPSVYVFSRAMVFILILVDANFEGPLCYPLVF